MITIIKNACILSQVVELVKKLQVRQQRKGKNSDRDTANAISKVICYHVRKV